MTDFSPAPQDEDDDNFSVLLDGKKPDVAHDSEDEDEFASKPAVRDVLDDFFADDEDEEAAEEPADEPFEPVAEVQEADAPAVEEAPETFVEPESIQETVLEAPVAATPTPVVMTRAERRRAESTSDSKALTPVTSKMNTRLTGEEVHADADYADVSETGVAYVVRLGEGILAELLLGSTVDPASDEFPCENLKEAVAAADTSKLERYFSNAYGAELIVEDEYGSIALKFTVPYDEAGVEGSSVEYMGYRVMEETKLVNVHVDKSLADTLVAGAASALGYEWSDTDGRYMKLKVVAYSANREQYKLMQDSASDFYALSNKAVTSSRGKWTKAADLYSAAANRAYDIGSRVRKSELSVEAQLLRDSATYRASAGNESDAQTREAYTVLADRFAEMARAAEDLS